MSTAELPAVRSALGMMTYRPHVSSVRDARRFVELAVTGAGMPFLADDAGLMVSELAANAVLHARSDFDVTVYEIVDGVRISVRDRSVALPVLVAPSATAMSGRGLALVQTLADQWGAGATAAAGKSVWFELVRAGAPADNSGGPVSGCYPAPVPDELSVEELLAAWSEDEHAAAAAAPPAPSGRARSGWRGRCGPGSGRLSPGRVGGCGGS